VEDLLTLGPRAQATLVDIKTSKNKNDSQVTSYIFMNLSHTKDCLISHDFRMSKIVMQVHCIQLKATKECPHTSN